MKLAPRIRLVWTVAGTMACAGIPSSNQQGDQDGSTTESGLETTAGQDSELPPLAKSIDILLVVDDSHAMGVIQGRLAAAVPQLVHGLEAGQFDYRIGIITTDNGHKQCRSLPGSGGKLRLESCHEHPDDFVDPSGSYSRFNTACAQHCAYEQLEAVPSTTTLDPQPRPRPWIERIGGVSNLPAGVDPAAALSCLVPRGINGCAIEAQLESLRQGLQRMLTFEDADGFGFVRDGASLAIVIVSDEADCSMQVEQSAAYEPTNKTFWSDPDLGPTASVCWNAGMSCSGSSGPYHEKCSVTDFALDGSRLAPEAAEQFAVLHPMSRYYKIFDGLQQLKLDVDPRRQLLVSLIGGVESDGVARYLRGYDGTPAQYEQFACYGVGAGCETTEVALDEVDPRTGEMAAATSYQRNAVPPGRMRDFVHRYASARPEEFMHSICEPDYAPAMQRILAQILAQGGG